MQKGNIKLPTPIQKADMFLTMFSKIIVWIIFIILFVILIKFDKNTFYPNFNIIKHNSIELKKEAFSYDKNNPINNSSVELKNINEMKARIIMFSDFYNKNSGMLKNKEMIELRYIYSEFIFKIDEINKKARHNEYISKNDYQDLMEILPTKEQMNNINNTLPKPFFKTFVIAIVTAIVSQFLIYFIGMLFVKIYFNIFPYKKDI